jgi:hypothetical protein
MSMSRRTALVSAAAALTVPVLPVIQAQAAAPKVGKQAPGFYRFNIGDFEVTALHDGATPYEVNAGRLLAHLGRSGLGLNDRQDRNGECGGGGNQRGAA